MEDKTPKVREEVERIVEAFNAGITALTTRLNELYETVSKAVAAQNSLALTLSTVERYLDGKDPDWDAGLRDAALERARLLARRRQIVEGITPESPVEDVDALLEVVRRLGSEDSDLRLVFRAYHAVGAAERAENVLAEIAGTGA